jgi:hypothetical protein
LKINFFSIGATQPSRPYFCFTTGRPHIDPKIAGPEPIWGGGSGDALRKYSFSDQ